MPEHEWVARKLDIPSSSGVALGGGLPRLIATGDSRVGCIDAAKRELLIPCDGELPFRRADRARGRGRRRHAVRRVGSTEGAPAEVPSCHGQQQEAEVGMAAKWGYHLDAPTDLAVLHCQYCGRESKLTMNWRDEAGWP